jgi:hypothetical protein
MAAGHRTTKGWQRRIGTVSNHGNLALRPIEAMFSCSPERFFIEMA